MAELTAETTQISRKPSAFDKRIHEIDFLRGFLILLVIFDHIMNHFAFDNNFWPAMQSAAYWYWYCEPRHIVRFIALIGFCFVSGVSCAFSRNNWLRAGQMIMFWAILAVGSTILEAWDLFGGSLTIYIPFNVIGTLAWSTLFYCFVQNKSWRSILVLLIVCFLMCQYVVPWIQNVNEIRGVYPNAPALYPPTYHPNRYGYLAWADWLPLFPFATFFMAGALVSYFVYMPTRKSIIKHKGNWEKFFCFCGRHSLIIYVVHQIILVPIFMLLNLIN